MYDFFKNKDIKVLYVEDDHLEREQAEQYLKKIFNTVIVAANGKEGLEFYKNNYFDVVVTDINMPVMDGVEMIQKIRELSPDQAIIVTSAYDFSDNLHSFLKRDVEFFIKKPFDLKNLATTINDIYSKTNEDKKIKDQEMSKDEVIDVLQKRNLELEKKIRILEDKIDSLLNRN